MFKKVGLRKQEIVIPVVIIGVLLIAFAFFATAVSDMKGGKIYK